MSGIIKNGWQAPSRNCSAKCPGTLQAFGTALKAVTGVSYVHGVDPLVLDLDGDGIELTARTSIAPFFDLDGDGFVEQAANDNEECRKRLSVRRMAA